MSERTESRYENGEPHISHDVEVQGQVSPVGHIGYDNGTVAGADHQKVGAASGEALEHPSQELMQSTKARMWV